MNLYDIRDYLLYNKSTLYLYSIKYRDHLIYRLEFPQAYENTFEGTSFLLTLQCISLLNELSLSYRRIFKL
jgi:hypothetical protein